MNARPSREAAQKAVEEFLGLTEDQAWFNLVEDGEDCWAFWFVDDDTTSYVHSDLPIEWSGTSMVLPEDLDC